MIFFWLFVRGREPSRGPRAIAAAGAERNASCPASRRRRTQEKSPTPRLKSSASRRVLAPSIPDLVAGVLILAVPLRGALDNQDTPAHLRLGETILATGQIPRVERLSYTLEGQPLVLSGWLSDVLFALALRLGGLEAVVLLTTAVLALAYGSLALLLRRSGVDARVSLVAMVFSIFLGTAGWSARPHVFSYLGTALLLCLLQRRERGAPWLYGLLFLAWANLHAGFVYGLALVALHWVGALCEVRWAAADAWRPAARIYLRGLTIGLLATLATPYGLGYYAQIRESLADPRLLSQVQEYGAPDLGEPEGLVLYGAVVALIVVFALVPRRPAVPVLLSATAFLYAALLAKRHVPLFGIVVPPLVALFASGHRWRSRPGYLLGDHLARIERRTAIGPVGGLLFLLVAGFLYSGSRAAEGLSRFDPQELPVEAVKKARAAGLEGRVFHDPNWGGYLLYAWPEKKAYITPLRYDLALVESALAVDRAAPGWRRELDRWGVATALLAPSSPLAAALAAEPDWVLWERDSAAVVLRRTGRSDSSAGQRAAEGRAGEGASGRSGRRTRGPGPGGAISPAPPRPRRRPHREPALEAGGRGPTPSGTGAGAIHRTREARAHPPPVRADRRPASPGPARSRTWRERPGSPR